MPTRPHFVPCGGGIVCGEDTLVASVNVLSAGAGSFAELETTTLFESVPAAVGVTVTSTETESPLLILPSTQRTVLPVVSAGSSAQSDELKTYVAADGSVSTTTTSFACVGPALLTTIV